MHNLLNRNALFVTIIVTILSSAIGMLTPILSTVSISLGATLAQVGLIFSVYSVARIFGPIPSSYLCQRLGVKKTMYLIILVLFLVVTLGYFVNGVFGLTVMWGFTGFVYSLWLPTMYTSIRYFTSPDQTGKLMGYVISGTSLGLGIGPFISGFISSKTTDYRFHFLVSALMILLTVFVMRKLPIRMEEVDELNEISEESTLMETKKPDNSIYSVLAVSGLGSFGGLVVQLMYIILPLYAVSELRFTTSESAFLLSVNFFSFAFSGFALGRLADKYSFDRVIVYSVLGIIGFLCLLPWCNSYSLAVCLFIVEGALGSLMGISLRKSLGEMGKKKKAARNHSIFSMIVDGMAIIGPIAFTLTYKFHRMFPFFLLAALGLLFLVFYFVVVHVEPKVSSAKKKYDSTL